MKVIIIGAGISGLTRRAAKQFHSTSRVQIMSRNLGFRLANAVINSRFTRRTPSRTESSAAP
jgi:hypothetical protein